MGMALGAGLTFMLRRGPSGKRPIGPALEGAGRGLKWAGTRALKGARRGAHWAGDAGEEIWEKVPREKIRRGVTGAMGTIDDAVEAELRSLRRAIRRRRKQLGL